MKISQNKRIAGKFMNCFIRNIRVKTNISCRVRKPVAVRLLSCQFLKKRTHLSVNHVMHISGSRYGNACHYACDLRKVFSPSHCSCCSFSHSVPGHLVYKRKRKGKGKSGHKGTHQVIGKLHTGSGKLCKEYRKILTAIIIVDGSLRIPQINCRQGGASHHGFHKTIIHKFFCSVCRRMKSRQIGPQQEKNKKQDFLPVHQIQMIYRKTLDPFFMLRFSKQKTAGPTGQSHPDTGQRSKFQQPDRNKKPG